MNETDWTTLLRRIKDGKCTPFLGAGVNAGMLPLGGEIARRWAQEEGYPLPDSADLIRVAQFLAVKTDDWMSPKERVLELFNKVKDSDVAAHLGRDNHPLAVLAGLPLPVYITTNYDDFMLKALRLKGKNPVWELCPWNSSLEDRPSVFDAKEGFSPTAETPLVFHLHGHHEVPESIVLTEDDYLDFLVAISRQETLLAPRIRQALTGSSLLFVGYRLADWNFRVLFRRLMGGMEGALRRISVAVQLPPDEIAEAQRPDAQEYLEKYFQKIQVRVHWGTADDFLAELGKRWEAFSVQ